MVKKRYMMYLEEGGPELLKALGINRSRLVDSAISSIISNELISNQRIIQSTDLQSQVSLYLTKCHLQDQAQELLQQKIEQNIYAKQREQEETEKLNDRLLSAYHEYCAQHDFPVSRFTGWLMGEDDGYVGFSEDDLRAHFERNNLPTDLNQLRPLIVVRR